ncbi:MAG: HigA family addiction module antitoxin [Kiritimatiellae bacterium]|nr:HigA family addiction module antitoxin [Kiritimatiellia bacterium]MDD4622905.1 HigA family addiction module antitoxin [Kiritimatiellia bacterium]
MNIPPGDFIREELESRDWKQEDLAQIVDLSPKHVSRIITGTDSISQDVAARLASAFGQSAEYWMNLETQYRARLVAPTEQTLEIADRALIYNHMPIREMVRLGWLRDVGRDAAALAAEVMAFWGLAKLDFSFMDAAAAMCMRSSAAHRKRFNPRHALTWLRKARLEADAAAAPKGNLNRKAAERIARRIPAYSASPKGVASFLADLNACGVRFVCVPHLPQTFLDGAAFFHGKQAVAAYTLRYDRVDNFWFVMAHELGHICKHLRDDTPQFLDSVDSDGKVNVQEEEADAFARECLGMDAMRAFAAASHGRMSEERVRAYAEEARVHPGIVVGFLQHEKFLSPRKLNDYKVPVSDALAKLNSAWMKPVK